METNSNPNPSELEVLREALRFYAYEWENDVDAERTINGWEGSIGSIQPTNALLEDFGDRARKALSHPSLLTGVEGERAQIVEWLRGEWEESHPDRLYVADLIEAGEHLPGNTDARLKDGGG